MESPLEPHEHREHAEHAAHAKNPMVARASITIAILAVLAASVGGLEALEAGGAVMESGRAVLAQDQATDAWGYYEAKGIKRHIEEIAEETAPARAADHKAKAAKLGDDQVEIKREAGKHEAERDAALKVAEIKEKRHHALMLAAILLQTAIAICTLAIITQKSWPWFASLTLSGVGALIALSAFLFS